MLKVGHINEKTLAASRAVIDHVSPSLESSGCDRRSSARNDVWIATLSFHHLLANTGSQGSRVKNALPPQTSDF
jgi:hypothetical protein